MNTFTRKQRCGIFKYETERMVREREILYIVLCFMASVSHQQRLASLNLGVRRETQVEQHPFATRWHQRTKTEKSIQHVYI